MLFYFDSQRMMENYIFALGIHAAIRCYKTIFSFSLCGVGLSLLPPILKEIVIVSKRDIKGHSKCLRNYDLENIRFQSLVLFLTPPLSVPLSHYPVFISRRKVF